MTSRFGKTYNRKGGEANSKFEEVFSNRKPTLTTRWGETTYKAQLGTKRSLVKSDVSELSKRPRLEDSDCEEDPFGFDSDEDGASPMKVGESDKMQTSAQQASKTPSTVAALTPAQSTANSAAKPTSKLSIFTLGSIDRCAINSSSLNCLLNCVCVANLLWLLAASLFCFSCFFCFLCGV